MQYRYFAESLEEVKKQFQKNYKNVLWAETQEEFEEIFRKCQDHDFLPNTYSSVLFDTFLFFDILTENNIFHLKYLEKHFKYIVFCGKNLEELHKRIQMII